MNTDVLKNKYDIDLDNEEIVTGLKKINEDEQSIEYDLNSIQKIDKQNLDTVLETSDLTDYKSLFAEKFSDYDFYSVSLKIKYEDEIVEKLNDILMIKPDGTFAGSMVINSYILYYNVSIKNSNNTTKDKEGIVVGDYNLICGTYIAEFPPMGDGSEDTMKGTLTINSDYTFTLKTEGYSDTDFLNKESDNCKGIFKIEYDVKEESGLSFDYLTFIPDDNSPSFSLRVNADNLLGDDWHQYRYQE